MKYALVAAVVLFSLTTFAGVRYFSNAGDDAADGRTPATAWRTIEKLNADLPAGGTALFRRGDVFYGAIRPKPGLDAAHRTTIAAYGEGSKPVISCAKVVRPDPEVWEDYSHDFWRVNLGNPSNYTGIVTDDCNPGHLIVDGTVHGWKRFCPGDLVSPWDFSGEDGWLYVHATNNPARLAKDIRVALNVRAVIFRSHTAISNIAVRATGAHGMYGGWRELCEDVRISDCDFENIGGSELPNYKSKGRPFRIRYGNGIEFGSNCRDAIIERCMFAGVYDTCFTMQGYPTLTGWQDIHVRNCTMTDSTQAYELWCMKAPKGMGFERCSFVGNRTLRVGGGWGAVVRPMRACATPLLVYTMETDTVDVDVSGNVFEDAPHGLLYKSGGRDRLPKGYRIHDNTCRNVQGDGDCLAREFRGTWIATVYVPRFSEDLSKKSIDGIKAYWRSMLDAAARVNVNAVIFQTRPCADALYRGALEPWSLYLRGEQGRESEGGFDPLQFMIDECHARGMQLHAWFNPFRVTNAEGDEKRLAKDHNYFRYPDWFVKYGKSVYYDPGVPACRDWTVKVILDVVARYDVDGVHIDDYFYPYRVTDAKGADVPFPDAKSFAKFGGGFADVNAWRDNNSDLLVKEIAGRLRELKPDVIFGVAPYKNNNYCLKYLHCDSTKWAKNGWVDYLIPQLYYGEHCRDETFWWDAHADGCPLFAGRFLKNLNKTVDHGPRKGLSELDNMLQMHGQMTNLTGVCWWSAHVMMLNTSNVTDRLAPHYVRKTLVPLYRNRPRTPPARVTEARADGRDGCVLLTWRHPEPSEGRPKACFTAVFRGSETHPEVVTDKTSVSLEAKPDETFRLVALDRLQNAAAPAVVRTGETGWNIRWNDISKKEQDEYIRRAEVISQ